MKIDKKMFIQEHSYSIQKHDFKQFQGCLGTNYLHLQKSLPVHIPILGCERVNMFLKDFFVGFLTEKYRK